MADTAQDAPTFEVHELEPSAREREIHVRRVYIISRGITRVCWMEGAAGIVSVGTSVTPIAAKAEAAARSAAYGRMLTLMGKHLARTMQAAE